MCALQFARLPPLFSSLTVPEQISGVGCFLHSLSVGTGIFQSKLSNANIELYYRCTVWLSGIKKAELNCTKDNVWWICMLI